MAPKKNSASVASPGINVGLLKQIDDATKAGTATYITRDDGLPLLQHSPPLIEVDTNQVVDGKALARLTAAGQAMVNGSAMAASSTSDEGAKASPYAILTNAALPVAKRGGKGGGAPTQYPFDKMEVGQSFFVPVSEKHDDPVKTLGSTVSSVNMRYAEETGQTKTVTRAKRGKKNKLELDANGNKIMETKTVPEYKFTRKFAVRRVEKGKKYGEWVADNDGALVQRTQ